MWVNRPLEISQPGQLSLSSSRSSELQLDVRHLNQCDMKHCLTNSKHRNLGAKRSALWPSKFGPSILPIYGTIAPKYFSVALPPSPKFFLELALQRWTLSTVRAHYDTGSVSGLCSEY